MAMSNIPADLKYSRSHEWVRLEGGEAVIGITDHAQNALSDVVYVELPAVGTTLSLGDKFGVVESVKAASDLYIPLSGMVAAVNEGLGADPSAVNSDPYGQGWMLRLKLRDLTAESGELLDAATYESIVTAEK
jgi:glycine cleavage system H protein